MLYFIDSVKDKFACCLQDDPVRNHIAIHDRIGVNRRVFAWVEDHECRAVTCVSLNDHVAVSEQDLFSSARPSVAIYYTIWSYYPGSAAELLIASAKYLIQEYNLVRIITLSPKTEMARKFHFRNGASLLQENAETINYEYCIADIKEKP